MIKKVPNYVGGNAGAIKKKKYRKEMQYIYNESNSRLKEGTCRSKLKD